MTKPKMLANVPGAFVTEVWRGWAQDAAEPGGDPRLCASLYWPTAVPLRVPASIVVVLESEGFEGLPVEALAKKVEGIDRLSITKAVSPAERKDSETAVAIARLIATDVLERFGGTNDVARMHESRTGIWNDHPAVQAVLATMYLFRTGRL